ncbi:MAG: cobalamin B12-binding domain-containing protein [Fidelibacterota bacterium]|nr:MAG: cobalamin B12-binding domain-containing protein [Candidatus Neomarinimicrobiota bacterium]
MEKRIRIVMAKPGLDGHDRGIKVLARAFRDAGMEVIYLGLRQTPEMIVRAAVQEDADVIALSILSGAHRSIFPKVQQLMHEAGLDNVLLTGGGIIPKKDMEILQQQRVGRLFGPGSSLAEIIEYVTAWVEEHRSNPDNESGDR